MEKEKANKFYWQNRERICKRLREAYKINRAAVLLRTKRYYQNHREEILNKKLDHYQKNKEVMRKRGLANYYANRERYLKVANDYYYRTKKTLSSLTSSFQLQNFHATKYNGHLFARIEKRRTHLLLLKEFEGTVRIGTKNKVIVPKGFKPFKFPVYQCIEPVPM